MIIGIVIELRDYQANEMLNISWNAVLPHHRFKEKIIRTTENSLIDIPKSDMRKCAEINHNGWTRVYWVCHRQSMKSEHSIECLGILYIALTLPAKYEMNDQSRIIIHFA